MRTVPARALAWIDPDDVRRVWFQSSDPDDPQAWTEPVLVHEAGDGCLFLRGDAGGGTVAIGAGCYERDAFVQQAPDHAVALVSADLVDWQTEELGEALPVPAVSADGREATWGDGIDGEGTEATWSIDDGF